MERQSNHIKYWTDTILHSYSQLFFSLNKVFAVILLLVTFFDVKIGFTGFLSVLLVNFFALVFGLNKQTIQQGFAGLFHICKQELKAVFKDQGVLIFFLLVPLAYPLVWPHHRTGSPA